MFFRKYLHLCISLQTLNSWLFRAICAIAFIKIFQDTDAISNILIFLGIQAESLELTGNENYVFVVQQVDDLFRAIKLQFAITQVQNIQFALNQIQSDLMVDGLIVFMTQIIISFGLYYTNMYTPGSFIYKPVNYAGILFWLVNLTELQRINQEYKINKILILDNMRRLIGINDELTNNFLNYKQLFVDSKKKDIQTEIILEKKKI